MSNLIYVSVDITCHETKSKDLYITSLVKVPARNKSTGKLQEISLKPKPKGDIKLFAWQLLCVIHGKSFDESNIALSLKNVQAYLIKGDEYNTYDLIRVRLYDGITISIFLNDNEKTLVTKFLSLDAEFLEKGKYEVMPFENPNKA